MFVVVVLRPQPVERGIEPGDRGVQMTDGARQFHQRYGRLLVGLADAADPAICFAERPACEQDGKPSEWFGEHREGAWAGRMLQGWRGCARRLSPSLHPAGLRMAG